MPIEFHSDPYPYHLAQFGSGDILISKGIEQGLSHENQVMLIPVGESFPINQFVDQKYWEDNIKGKSSDDIPVPIRLVFDKVESIDALVAELQELREIIAKNQEGDA